ncbi:Rad52/Rad22 family DNA repair protein [Micromonospora sp. HUAS LYJ1]|uniref:Rad52/Rad22 family DNA repair protein n=1 Tax=Micromonospora sp. HUAS LYJ1 TaxID=3061626 RepID=UPI002672A6ED|nr:Rad52/Rad22 family DNA repair protein [Micromonospora sp. HUAS LYJ1]WKU03725.1 Rad52/Rad22 family DNA repair protein [Micromonospora sp. HUAS LYJ1]
MNALRPRFQLTPEQYERLTMPLDGNRVGKNPKGFSHLEAWDVRRWLIRVFGFGCFDVETIALDLVKELEIAPGTIKYRNGGSNDKTIWTVVYRAQVRLTVYDQFGGKVVLEDGACGDSTNQPSVGDCHDNASKTALSQALKRCAVNLGDCFGLSLYNGGGIGATVNRSLVGPAGTAAVEPAQLPAEDAPVQPEPGTAPAAVDEHQEPAQPERPVSSPPAAEPRPAPTAVGVRDWTLKPDRTADGIRKAATKLLSEHPAVAAKRVTNEHGDDEQLSVLMERRAKELDPKMPAASGDDLSDRRRKRLFALFRDLGYDGPANQQQRRTIAARVLGREVTSMSEVTDAKDIEQIIRALEGQQRQRRQPIGATA